MDASQVAIEALALAFARTTHGIEVFVRDQIETCDSDWRPRLRAHIQEQARSQLASALDQVLGTPENTETYTAATVFSIAFNEALEQMDRDEAASDNK